MMTIIREGPTNVPWNGAVHVIHAGRIRNASNRIEKLYYANAITH